MDKDGNTSAPVGRRLWLYPIRALAVLAIFMLLRTLTAMRIYSLGLDDPGGMNLPSQVPYIFVLITNAFILNSILYLFSTYDHTAARRYKENLTERRVYFIPEIKKILSSYEFISETAVLIAGVCLFSSFGWLAEGYACFFGKYEAPELYRTLLPLATFIPTVFFTSLLSRYEARRYWCQLINIRNFSRLDEKLPLILRSLAILIMYPLVFPYAPFVVYMLITVFAVLAKIARVLTVLGVALVGAFIFLITVGLSRLKFISRRRDFISAVAAIADEKKNTIQILSKEERKEKKHDFTYTEGELVYDVKILYARRGVPLFFTAKNDAFFRHRIGTKNHHLTMERHFDYSLAGENRKALVIIKFPKNVFVASDGASRKMVAGDKMWDTVIFDEQTFLGSAERSCLERFNTGRW